MRSISYSIARSKVVDVAKEHAKDLMQHDWYLKGTSGLIKYLSNMSGNLPS
jgi:hypothetical protein